MSKTGAYAIAGGLGLDSQSALECPEVLEEIFGDVSGLVVAPIEYMHGACDVFARALSRRFGYSIRAYWYDGNAGPMLLHAVCRDDAGNWVDVRGMTADEDEMLSVFSDDIARIEADGRRVHVVDFPFGKEGVRQFRKMFGGHDDKEHTMLDEADNVIWLADELAYCL